MRRFPVPAAFLFTSPAVRKSILALIFAFFYGSASATRPEEAPVPQRVYHTFRTSGSPRVGFPVNEPVLYTVRGRVAMPDSTPFVGVEVSTGELTTRTDDYGFYSFQLPDGLYTISFHVNSTEIPESVDVRVNGADVFVELHPLEKHTVRGRLLGREGPIRRMSVLAGSKTAVADDQGWFSFLLPDREYLLELDAGDQYFPSARAIKVKDGDVMLGDISVNRLAWSFAAIGEVKSTPLVGPDGTVYLITSQGEPSYLHALAPDGKLRKKYDIDSNIISSPVQGLDGTIYIAAWGAILALTRDLTLAWKLPVPETGAISAPTLGANGIIYFGCHNRAYALNPDGTVRWKYAVDGWVTNSPVSGEDGILYFRCEDGAVYALNPDGSLRKKYENGETPDSGPDSAVSYVCRNGILSAVRADGTVQWEFPGIDSYTYAWVYPPTGEIWTWKDGYPLGINPDGTLKWKHRAPWGTPASGPGGRLYATYVENSYLRTTYLYAIDMVDPGGTVVSVESGGAVGGIGNGEASPPAPLRLFPNHPNPFNPSTMLEFTLPESGEATLAVYSLSGQRIRTLVSGKMAAGGHTVVWDGRDERGRAVSSGVYFARITAGKATAVRKMLLVR